MNIVDVLKNDAKKNIGITNVTDDFFAWKINQIYDQLDKDIMIILPTLHEAEEMNEKIKSYTNDVLLFPVDDLIGNFSLTKSSDFLVQRINVLNSLLVNKKSIIITHLEGMIFNVASKEKFVNQIINIEVGKKYSRDCLLSKLLQLGYNRQSIVSTIGEVGARGYILDVFPQNLENPIRIEFFDDIIDSIRIFDSITQQSIKKIDKIEILPFKDNIDEKDNKTIVDYLDNPLIFLKDYNRSKNIINKTIEKIENTTNNNYNLDAFFSLNSKSVVYFSNLEDNFSNLNIDKIYNYNIKSLNLLTKNPLEIEEFINKQIKEGNTIILSIKKEELNRIKNYLTLNFIITNKNSIYSNKINIVFEGYNFGFIYNNFVIITSNDLFGKSAIFSKDKSFRSVSKSTEICKFEIGDYVVHNTYGIGVYNGIKTISKNKIQKDYIEVLYRSNDKLYIPVSKIELLSKYSGKEGAIPKINKLGGVEWQKAKQHIRERIKDVAERIIKVQAARKLKKGFKFSKDSPLQEVFENEFLYALTDDQQKAVNEIKEDMEKVEPMDRILCGDVGYGKTEVAFRAMFKAVMDSKQVLYLCPTTLLSMQQYSSAAERFKNFPINIELINRHTPLKKAREIIEKLSSGQIDILFGTHRILSDDIKPNNLGLLVVDEEQRFGVVHKEKIKTYKSDIDILTLTATPIPRTMQMAMLGIRNLSLIETPPINRQPVQTYVMEENFSLIKEIIEKELLRKGQVYILYNRVSDIEVKQFQIKRLIPEINIAVAHGQMEKTKLEDTMIDFINKKYDVLICTTIIETGIDIPNVNTLIILDADRFGLSQLYQIRGRVGRSDKLAYAYLMYKHDKLLTEEATKRLNVIKEFTELGSGFSIATRDLSIRGAGDILGSEQAGFIDSVGIELYLRMLNEEMERQRGKEVPENGKEELQNSINGLDVETHINDKYVEDEDLKIFIHQQINKINSEEKFIEIKGELEDRFGKIDNNLLIYMYSQWLENLCIDLGINNIVDNQNYIEVVLSKTICLKISFEDFFIKSIKINSNFKFNYINDCLVIKLFKKEEKKKTIKDMISLLEEIKY